MGPVFAADREDGENYIDDRYGGHLSPRGNRIVAEALAADVFAETERKRARG